MKEKKELTVRIAGKAGQGMQTIGMALCRIFKNAGFNIFANQDYMSRIRGGNNFFQIRISEKPSYTLRAKSDIIVALDKESVALHRKNLNRKGIVILDKAKFNITEPDASFVDVPLHEIAQKLGDEFFVNSVACGLVSRIINIGFNYVEEVLTQAFSKKGEDVVSKNIEAAREGYNLGGVGFAGRTPKPKSRPNKDNFLINGNDAIALGAIKAGCKFYTAYPMTPSTGIMNVVAHYARDFNIVLEQAEDEIAAINMAVGASFAGARSMTATSGGGFALMTEGLSLAAMTETPIVVVDAQRPAPATGFPTRTEQGDLEFLLHAGHGEFTRAVYAPGTAEEAFRLTVKAFNVSEKYQIPALILTDQHLADLYRDIDKFDPDRVASKRYIISKEDSKDVGDYKRYLLTKSGISPRAVPSWIKDVIYADSDEHTEEGHITEDGSIRNKMVEKRLYKKMNALTKEIERPTSYNTKKANTILVGFGSTYGVMREATEANNKLGFVHFSQIWPFPAKEACKLLKGAKKILTVENNASAQFARLLKRETGIESDGSILKFDGRPFDLDFLTERLKRK